MSLKRKHFQKAVHLHQHNPDAREQHTQRALWRHSAPSMTMSYTALHRGALATCFGDYRRRKPPTTKVGSKVKLYKKIIIDGGEKNIKIVFQHLLFFSGMRSCLKAFCKATNGQCVVLPAASWSALCQTQTLSRRKVKQHFFPLWRVRLSNLLYFLSSWRLLNDVLSVKLFCSSCRCFSSNTSCGCEAAGRQSISHNPTAETPEYPFIKWVYFTNHTSYHHISMATVSTCQVTAGFEKEKSSNEFWLLFSL